MGCGIVTYYFTLKDGYQHPNSLPAPSFLTINPIGQGNYGATSGTGLSIAREEVPSPMSRVLMSRLLMLFRF